MEDLIKFLRTSTSSAYNKVAADHIEELVKERDEYKDAAKIWQEDFIQENQRLYEAKVKLAEAVAFIRRHIPDSVYEQRQRANAFLAELEKTK